MSEPVQAVVSYPPAVIVSAEVQTPETIPTSLPPQTGTDVTFAPPAAVDVIFPETPQVPTALLPTGPPGADAYAVAVQAGFEGTREEWLASLQGTAGAAGAAGAKGDQGDPGPAGPAGTNAEIVVCANLAAYLALAPAVQMDGRWYVVPK